MPRWIALMAMLLVAAACGGGTASPSSSSSSDATTTTVGTTSTTGPSGFTVVSEDGDLEIDVPFEAMAEDPGITIRVLSPEEYPPELAGAGETPGTVIYSMEPDGLTFDAPVRVTRRLSASNFEDLEEFEVPVVVMLTTGEDGFEVMSDLRVQRDGDDIFASGETTHFSPAVTLYGRLRVQFDFDDYHRSFEGEEGLPIYISPRFTNEGPVSTGPLSVQGVGYTRDDEAMEFQAGEFLGIECLIPGEYKPRVGFDVEFNLADPAEGEPTVHGVRTLAPDVDRLQIKVKNVAPLMCFNPETSIHGVGFDFEVASDHPGGVEWVPGGDFMGGNSAAYGWFSQTTRLDGAWVGLIGDGNGNGIVDPTDTMFPVYEVKDYGGMTGFVAPLFSYGDYFVYVIDGNQFDWNPGADYGVGPVGEIVAYLETLYRGMGRFDSAIALVTHEGSPWTYSVDSSEDVQSVSGAEAEIFTPGLFQFRIEVRF